MHLEPVPSIRGFKCEVSSANIWAQNLPSAKLFFSSAKLWIWSANISVRFALGILFEVRIFAVGIFLKCEYTFAWFLRGIPHKLGTKFQVRIFALQKKSKCEYSHFKQNSKCEPFALEILLQVRKNFLGVRNFEFEVRSFALETPCARHWLERLARPLTRL